MIQNDPDSVINLIIEVNWNFPEFEKEINLPTSLIYIAYDVMSIHFFGNYCSEWIVLDDITSHTHAQ